MQNKAGEPDAATRVGDAIGVLLVLMTYGLMIYSIGRAVLR